VLGVPDSRPETLGHAVPGPLPITLIHEEVQDGNVHVREGRPVFIDWAEASVSHPFAGLTNTLRIVSWRFGWEPGGPEVLRLRDAYLEPWTRFAPADELRAIFADGYALGALARAATWERIGDREKADAWREIHAEACSAEARLGA
jgi:Phosphotransferase enzyme family